MNSSNTVLFGIRGRSTGVFLKLPRIRTRFPRLTSGVTSVATKALTVRAV
jgi:hypothetical protein